MYNQHITIIAALIILIVLFIVASYFIDTAFDDETPDVIIEGARGRPKPGNFFRNIAKKAAGSAKKAAGFAKKGWGAVAKMKIPAQIPGLNRYIITQREIISSKNPGTVRKSRAISNEISKNDKIITNTEKILSESHSPSIKMNKNSDTKLKAILKRAKDANDINTVSLNTINNSITPALTNLRNSTNNLSRYEFGSFWNATKNAAQSNNLARRSTYQSIGKSFDIYNNNITSVVTDNTGIPVGKSIPTMTGFQTLTSDAAYGGQRNTTESFVEGAITLNPTTVSAAMVEITKIIDFFGSKGIHIKQEDYNVLNNEILKRKSEPGGNPGDDNRETYNQQYITPLVKNNIIDSTAIINTISKLSRKTPNGTYVYGYDPTHSLFFYMSRFNELNINLNPQEFNTVLRSYRKNGIIPNLEVFLDNCIFLQMKENDNTFTRFSYKRFIDIHITNWWVLSSDTAYNNTAFNTYVSTKLRSFYKPIADMKKYETFLHTANSFNRNNQNTKLTTDQNKMDEFITTLRKAGVQTYEEYSNVFTYTNNNRVDVNVNNIKIKITTMRMITFIETFTNYYNNYKYSDSTASASTDFANKYSGLNDKIPQISLAGALTRFLITFQSKQFSQDGCFGYYIKDLIRENKYMINLLDTNPVDAPNPILYKYYIERQKNIENFSPFNNLGCETLGCAAGYSSNASAKLVRSPERQRSVGLQGNSVERSSNEFVSTLRPSHNMSAEGFLGMNNDPFGWIYEQMLELVELSGLSGLVSWSREGKEPAKTIRDGYLTALSKLNITNVNSISINANDPPITEIQFLQKMADYIPTIDMVKLTELLNFFGSIRMDSTDIDTILKLMKEFKVTVDNLTLFTEKLSSFKLGKTSNFIRFLQQMVLLKVDMNSFTDFVNDLTRFGFVIPSYIAVIEDNTLSMLNNTLNIFIDYSINYEYGPYDTCNRRLTNCIYNLSLDRIHITKFNTFSVDLLRTLNRGVDLYKPRTSNATELTAPVEVDQTQINKNMRDLTVRRSEFFYKSSDMSPFGKCYNENLQKDTSGQLPETLTSFPTNLYNQLFKRSSLPKFMYELDENNPSQKNPLFDGESVSQLSSANPLSYKRLLFYTHIIAQKPFGESKKTIPLPFDYCAIANLLTVNEYDQLLRTDGTVLVIRSVMSRLLNKILLKQQEIKQNIYVSNGNAAPTINSSAVKEYNSLVDTINMISLFPHYSFYVISKHIREKDPRKNDSRLCGNPNYRAFDGTIDPYVVEKSVSNTTNPKEFVYSENYSGLTTRKNAEKEYPATESFDFYDKTSPYMSGASSQYSTW